MAHTVYTLYFRNRPIKESQSKNELARLRAFFTKESRKHLEIREGRPRITGQHRTSATGTTR